MTTLEQADRTGVGSAPGLLDRERIIAAAGFNRWLVPPAALCIHLCIGMAYGFSVFWLPLSRAARVAVDSGASSVWTGVLAAAAPLAGHDRALLIGRHGGPAVLDSEVARLGYLATLASTLVSTGGSRPPREP